MNLKTFERHIENEKSHWWFKGRREILDTLIKKKNKSKKISILDFGAGSGTNINMLKNYGIVYIYEKNEKMKKYLKKKYKKNKKIFIVNNYRKKKYDLILAADVIEHIKNDRYVVNNLYKILKKDGKIVITVPAFQFLFSQKDIQLRHYRRYNLKTIKNILKKFNTLKISYFNFFLFLPLSITIIFFKLLKIDFIAKAEKTPNIIINKFLYSIFKAEKYFLNFINFPFGLSIVFIGQKNEI